jgi:excisionase family DNA binding protein
MTASADRFGPGRSREELRLAQVASGLLMLLDAHRLTGRLPLDVQVQASRLRHAVKLAVQAEAPHLPRLAPPPPPAPGPDPAAVALRAWIASQPWVQPGPLGWVYLLCFRDPATGAHRPLRGKGVRGQYAGHYWGWTDDLIRRITREHRNPRWHGAGRLVQVALKAGLSFELAWLEYPATRGRERRLKNQGSAYRRCPCAAAPAAPSTRPLPLLLSSAPRFPTPDLAEGGEPMPASRSWLRTSEAAARLHVSAKTVTRWANEGRLQHRRTLGGHRRYDPELLDALVNALTYRP